MKKKEIIKSNIYFNKIIQNRQYFKNEMFVIYQIKKSNKKPHFGIAVSKKFGNAVERNRIKRQIRNIIDENKFLFPNNQDYIIMIKELCKNKKYKLLNESFNNLLNEKVIK